MVRGVAFVASALVLVSLAACSRPQRPSSDDRSSDAKDAPLTRMRIEQLDSATAAALPRTALDTVRIGRDGVAPPDTYVDRGVCPFECCVYREWLARAPIQVYRIEGDTTAVAFVLAAGERFLALTGNVHLRPTGIALVRRNLIHSVGPDVVRRSEAGDTLYVLSYLGESHYNLWSRGEVLEGYGCWGEGDEMNAPTKPCELIREPREYWWAEVQNQAGLRGWIDMNADDDKVGHKDACSID